MSEFLPFIIAGLATGSVFGLAGLGLVLTFKTTGIFNFAHGAVGAVGAYTFFELYSQRGVPWPIALVVSVFVLGPILGLLLELMGRALARVGAAMKIVATVGLFIFIQELAILIYGAQARLVEPYFPVTPIRVGGVNLGVDQLINILVALVAAAGLYVFVQRSRLGQAMQAVVDDPQLLAISGTSPTTVRRWAWVIGATFATLSAVLLLPFVGLEATVLTLLVVQAFGAAAVGAFNGLVLTYVGGLGIGVLGALSTKYVGSIPQLGGLPSSIPFIVLFVVLLITPKRRLVEAGAQARLLTKPPPATSPVMRAVGFGGLGLFLLFTPSLVGARLAVFTSGLTQVIIFLSLYLLVRLSGQISLAHAAFAAVGAAAFSHLVHGIGLPWVLGLLGAGLFAVPIGAIVAIPAIRLSGVYLAVATLGFGILLERLMFRTGLMFGARDTRIMPRPDMSIMGLDLSGDRGYFYVVLAVTAVLGMLVTLVLRGRLGRLLRAMSDSPVGLRTHGIEVNITRVLIFCLSAFMAGIAGALLGGLSSSVNAVSFVSFKSLEWLAVLVIAGAVFRYAPFPTALLAAFVLAILPSYLEGAWVVDYLPPLFGLGAIAHALITDRELGGTPDFAELAERTAARARRSPVRARMEPTPIGDAT